MARPYHVFNICYMNLCKSNLSRKFSSDCKQILRKNTLKFSSYDCIGFDLDGTVAYFNLHNKVLFCYDVISRFLVEKKKYSECLLFQPIEKDLDYVQKGLFLDLKRGNILKLNHKGVIDKALHGLTSLNVRELERLYGEERRWNCAAEFLSYKILNWEQQFTPSKEKVHAILDYFSLASILCFARAVETLKIQGASNETISLVGEHVLEGLIYLYSSGCLKSKIDDFYEAVRNKPSSFYKNDGAAKTIPHWLRNLKKAGVKTFLCTGSYDFFASNTANYVLGCDWRELFDFVIYNGKKPGFFVGDRPFCDLNGSKLSEEDVQRMIHQGGAQFNAGNWTTLYKLFEKINKKQMPKCLYVGDNILQDVYASTSSAFHCESLALCEEMCSENIPNVHLTRDDLKIVSSEFWGPFFSVCGPDGESNPSFWCNVITNRSKMCIPSLHAIVGSSLDREYSTFSSQLESTGFYPKAPHSVIKAIANVTTGKR